MESDNLEVWERGLTASERRILISNFVAVANDEVMKNESSCLSCFRRCGVLLTLDGTGDELIKPQGCTKLPISIPETVNQAEENYNNPLEILQPEDWDSGVIDDDTDIHVAEITENDTDEEGTDEEVQVGAQEEITVLADEDREDEECSDDLPETVTEQHNVDTEKELDSITEDYDQGGGQVRVQDNEEHKLIKMATTESYSRSGRRQVPPR